MRATTRITNKVGQVVILDNISDRVCHDGDHDHIRNMTITEIKGGRRIVIETVDAMIPVLDNRID